MSLTNPNSLVTEERLNQFYGQILPYLGGMPDVLANKFSKGDLYSTDEKMIGVWIDGKPLYQKTVDCGALPNNNTKTVNHNISDIDVIVHYYGIAQNGDTFFTLPYVHKSTVGAQVSVVALKSEVQIQTGSDRSAFTKSYVTLQYTKTTDSAISIGSDTDYSTTEKIIGTWVDGKPLYQKTVDCGALPNNSSKATAHNISNMDVCVGLDGMAIDSSSGEFLPIPNAHKQTFASQIQTACNRTNVYIMTGSDQTRFNGYITIRYTKTTD